MSSNGITTEPLEHVDKGKRRAQEPTENTPLLASTSTILDDSAPPDSRRRLRSKLTTVFLVSLSICILAFVVIALLAWTYASRASHLTPEDIINHDLTLAGPDRVDVLNITDGGIWMKVEGRIGMDAGSAIGIGSHRGDGVLQSIWKSFGRWGVEALDRVSVDMSTIVLKPEYDQSLELVTLKIPPIELPLTVDPPKDLSWLTRVSEPIFIKPTANSTLILQYLKESWRTGSFAVRADVGKATVRGGSLHQPSWRSMFHGTLSNVRASLHMKLPSIPSFPLPGRQAPFPSLSQLLTLTSFNVSSDSAELTIQAAASLMNPAPSTFDASILPLPFTVSILSQDGSSPVSVASVSTSPFALTHPNITLSISGKVLPLSSASFPVLSHFVTRYLSNQSNTILISSPLFPYFSVKTDFPAPNPRPHLLRNVSIHDMKIKPIGTAFLASGTVHARVVLPKGVDVGLDVYRVLPDVLIFDGEVPPSPSTLQHKKHRNDDTDVPPEAPLPDPLPQNAFGHIRPDNWLPSISHRIEPEEGGDGASYAVTAEVIDVPLRVLPGRQKQFSNFVGKVIFGVDGAVAGILGSAAVTVAVEGLPLHGPGRKSGEIVLSGLPFQGSVLIGKKSL